MINFEFTYLYAFLLAYLLGWGFKKYWKMIQQRTGEVDLDEDKEENEVYLKSIEQNKQ